MSNPTSMSFASRAFKFSLTTWFVCLLLAQITFVAYLLLSYAYSGLSTDLSQWTRFNDTAYVADDTVGNGAYAAHVLLAIFMILGGSLQLIPKLRNRYRKFHRINGRIFVCFACIIALAGMYLMIARGTVGDAFMHSLTFFGGLVILCSSYFAVKAAINRNFAIHQQWAIRLFLAANGVLFFRLMLFAWFLTFGAIGINTETFTGPTLVAVSICSYVIPLLIAELVRYAQKLNKTWLNILCTTLMTAISTVFLIGLIGITLANWYPSVMAYLTTS